MNWSKKITAKFFLEPRTDQQKETAVSSGATGWDFSRLCESEPWWWCCYPQCSGTAAELCSVSSGSSLEWTPGPSGLSAPEENGPGVGGESVGGNCFRESCAAGGALLC